MSSRAISYDPSLAPLQDAAPLAALPDDYRTVLGLVQVDLTGDWVNRELLIGTRDPEMLSRSARLMLDHLSTVASAQA